MNYREWAASLISAVPNPMLGRCQLFREDKMAGTLFVTAILVVS